MLLTKWLANFSKPLGFKKKFICINYTIYYYEQLIAKTIILCFYYWYAFIEIIKSAQNSTYASTVISL